MISLALTFFTFQIDLDWLIQTIINLKKTNFWTFQGSLWCVLTKLAPSHSLLWDRVTQHSFSSLEVWWFALVPNLHIRWSCRMKKFSFLFLCLHSPLVQKVFLSLWIFLCLYKSIIMFTFYFIRFWWELLWFFLSSYQSSFCKDLAWLLITFRKFYITVLFCVIYFINDLDAS